MDVLVPRWLVYGSVWVAAGAVLLLLLAIATVRAARTWRTARSALILEPLADDLLAVSCGEDPEGLSAARLVAVPRQHRATLERAIVSRLEFLRGTTARALTDVLEAWGVRPRWARSCRSLLASRRATAVTDLGLLGDPATAGVVLPLLRDRNLRVRTSAVRAMGRMQSPEGAAGVLGSVAPTSRGNVPMWVAMEGLAFPAAEDAVRDAITDVSPHVRAAAAHAATLSGWPSVAAQLRRALPREEDPTVRTHQIRALGVVGSDRDTAVLQDLVLSDAPRTLRVAAIGALSELGGDPGVLGQLLEDTDATVSRAAASALARLGTPGRAVLAAAPQPSQVVLQEMALAEVFSRRRRPELGAQAT
ncbi:HEAT repeat domain-containing protein [Tessaracoccus sp.]